VLWLLQMSVSGSWPKLGRGPVKKGTLWHSDNPGPRSKTVRRQRDADTIAAATLAESYDSDDVGAAWLERAQYWESQAPESAGETDPFNAPRIEQSPLILNGHGVNLRVHQGALVVRNGFTHYPQKNAEMRFFAGSRKLPPRIVVLDGDGSISFDVIAWLSRKQIPLVMLSWQGEVVSTVGSTEGPFDPALRAAQYAALTNGVGIKLATQLIRGKVQGCQETLLAFWRSPARDAGLQKLQRVLIELETTPPSFEALRMIEARAALAYFLCWQEIPLQWTGIGRKPIPQEWHRAGLRQGLLSGSNRHATHPVNAMLNYAYAALESQLRIATAARGLNPTIGYLHASFPNRLALIYDLMEPLRPQVDRLVLEFVRTNTLRPADFALTATGVCRLHPQLARHVAVLTVPTKAIDSGIERALGQIRCKAPEPVDPKRHTPRTSGLVRPGRPSRHALSAPRDT
jgi:CRISPR-associated endonuclease Cas1